MRLWSIHPQFLDAKGLVALWREGLLAQKVLMGQTRGYRHHSQLLRFQVASHPLSAIAHYLHAVADEADKRQYRFQRNKIQPASHHIELEVSEGQLAYEWAHLHQKLAQRDPEHMRSIAQSPILPHPLFRVVYGDIADWEVIH